MDLLGQKLTDLNVGRSGLLLVQEHQQHLQLAAGGDACSTEYVANEQWNGSAWTEVGDLNTKLDHISWGNWFVYRLYNVLLEMEAPAFYANTENLEWNKLD